MNVHGGLTFSDRCQPGAEEHGICHVPEPGEPDDVWWFGFDCAHCDDLAPAYEKTCIELGMPSHIEQYADYSRSYKTVRYVQRQCAELAEQLAVIE